MSHFVGLENAINFEEINQAFKEVEDSIKRVDETAATFNKTQGEIFAEKAGIYLDAIDKFLAFEFKPESDVIRYFALEAEAMQNAADAFEASVEYLRESDIIYNNLTDQLTRISRLSADGRMSELERLNEIKNVQEAAVDAALALGRTDDVRFVNLQAQLAATNAALEDTESGAGAVASILDRLNERRQLITTTETELAGGVITPGVQLNIDTQVLAEIENAIREIIELNQHVNSQDYDNLLAEWNSLSQTVQLSEEAIAAFAAEREQMAARIAEQQALEELGRFFEILKNNGLGYIDVLGFMAASNRELTDAEKELLLSTFDLSRAQGLIAEETDNYERSVALLALRLRLGLITESEALNEQLSLAEDLLFLAAATTDEFSAEAETARARVQGLRDAIDNLNQSIDELTLRYELGLINRQEYLTQQISVLQEELVELAAQYGVNSQEVDEHKEKIKKLEDELKELTQTQNDYGESLRKVAGLTGGAGADFANFAAKVADSIKAFAAESGGNVGEMIGSIVGAFNELLGPIDDSTGQLIQSISGVAASFIDTLIPGAGQAVAAIGSLIGSLFGLGNSAKRARKDVESAFGSVQYLSKETAAELTKLEGTTKKVRADGFLGWLGFKKTIKDDKVVTEVIGYFNQIASAISGALGSALDASMGGEDWEAAFKQNFNDSILNTVKETFIQATLLASGFQEIMAEFAKKMKEDGPEAAFAYLTKELPNVLAEAEDAVAEFGKNVPGLFKLDDLWEATEENINRIKKNILEGGKALADGLVDTLIRLATQDGLVNEASLNALVSLAETISGGFEQGLRRGINSFLDGKQDWKDDLREGIKSTIVSSLIDAFIASAAVQVIAGDFVAGFIRELENGSENARDWAAANIKQAVDDMSALIEAFVSGIGPELLPSTNPRSRDYRPPEDTSRDTTPSPRDAGNRISEITGPTRDLLIDLLTPLSILPSWTSLIRDIRNDVRAMATSSGIIGVPAAGVASLSAAGTTIQSQTIVINNPTINTQAKDARELYRELSGFAFKERRGGK
jgi:hypothetical protein